MLNSTCRAYPNQADADPCSDRALEEIFGPIPPFRPMQAPFPDATARAVELMIALKIVADPSAALRINTELLESDLIAFLALMTAAHPTIAKEIGALGLACVLNEDYEQIELIEWLSRAPGCVKKMLPSIGQLLEAFESREGTKQRPFEPEARVLAFPPRFDNAAWLKEVDRARAEVRP